MNFPTNPVTDPPGVANSVIQATSQSIVTKLRAAARDREEASPGFDFLEDI